MQWRAVVDMLLYSLKKYVFIENYTDGPKFYAKGEVLINVAVWKANSGYHEKEHHVLYIKLDPIQDRLIHSLQSALTITHK